MLTALLGVLSPVVERLLSLIPNQAERDKARLEYELKMREQEQELLKAFINSDHEQVEVNKVEAASTSLFVSGWRPFVGWVCGAGFAWAFVVKPLLDWVLAAAHSTVVTPALNTGELTQLLLGLLGMGAIRSFEKVRGVASK